VGVGDAASIAQAESLLAEGNALEDRGDFAGALAKYEAARTACPEHARVPLNVANALRGLGRSDDAIRTLKDAVAAQPGNAAAHFNLGSLYLAQSRPAEAESAFRSALAADPAMAEAAVALAGVLESRGRVTDAEAALKQAIDAKPQYAGARFNLALLYERQERCDEAEAALKSVDTAALPRGHVAGAFGELYLKMGRHAQAGEALLAAMREENDKPDAGSGYLFSLNFRNDVSAEHVFREHARIGALIERHAGAPYTSWNVPWVAERRLKVGYVSGDFVNHPVARFLAPVLAQHDRSGFDVHCFSNHASSDDITRQLRRYATHWHEIAGASDASVAERIRALGIDILVDLSGHTTRHRLGVFARRPAPVQAAWLGYLNTTGLSTIDHRIVDRHTDPEGDTERFNTEQLVRLPQSQWCYLPFDALPRERSSAPAVDGAVVFGSFNQRVKITDATLNLWGRILRELPDSRLLVMDVADGWARREFLSRLTACGIAGDRVQLLPREDPAAYFARIASVDIAFDTFPYNGATTTFDTLWMGTPMVALRGDRGIARGGYSILSELGVDALVAQNEDDYVRANVRLAQDLSLRTSLHSTLRDRLRASPLLDTLRFVRNLEAAYRDMWRRRFTAAR
jgi:predicted O-linked N-acetylglucosamine transferase (SPINDLY family)